MTRLDTVSCRKSNSREFKQRLELSIAQSRVKVPLHESVGSEAFIHDSDETDLQTTYHPDTSLDREARAERWNDALVSPGGNRSARYRFIKRLGDMVGAIGLLAICSPLLIVTCLVLTFTTKGRPFFRQTRYGLFGKPFTLYKFRTMVSNAEDLRHLIQRDGLVFKKRNCADPRVTRVGAFLHKTSIDEVPQLVNVLLGQMSLVGPRPLSCEIEKFEPWQLERFLVRPGLTCLWQVSGRSEIGFEEWMLMDLWYVQHQSLRTDAMLLIRTPGTVLSCRGAG